MSTNAYIKYLKLRLRAHEGPLGAYIDLYASQLMEQGYVQEMGRRCIGVVADLSRWLERKGLILDDIDEKTLHQYHRYRECCGHPYLSDRPALERLLAMLRDLGVCRPKPPVVPNLRGLAVEDFKRYLLQDRGLSNASVARYLPFICQFLQERFGDDALHWDALSAEDVTRFVLHHAPKQSPRSAQLLCTALRSFLRYLQYRGETMGDLASCVPAVASRRFSTVPQYLSASQVQSVLEHCEHRSAGGKRDYAVLLLLARLGLRANEIVTLRLQDIDWQSGQLTVHGKGATQTQLPLPVEVGEAIADYLQNGRPHSVCRQVFLRKLAPHTGFSSSGSIFWIAKNALARAAIQVPRNGAHLFRHSLATQMLRTGASLTEIGQLLRHQHPDTTRIYAKVDIAALRTLALPWPGGAQ